MVFRGADPANSRLCLYALRGQEMRSWFGLDDLPEGAPPQAIDAFASVLSGGPNAVATYTDGAAKIKLWRGPNEIVANADRASQALRVMQRREDGGSVTETSWWIDPVDGLPLRKDVAKSAAKDAAKDASGKRETVTEWRVSRLYHE